VLHAPAFPAVRPLRPLPIEGYPLLPAAVHLLPESAATAAGAAWMTAVGEGAEGGGAPDVGWGGEEEAGKVEQRGRC
jgi:hypothetical protein